MKPNLLTVYGILKAGYSLDLTREGGKFLARVEIPEAALYHIGEGVGLIRETGSKAYGELFEIPDRLWTWLDRIEGHPYVYRRELITINPLAPASEASVESWIYVHQNPQYFSGKIESGKYENDSEYAKG